MAKCKRVDFYSFVWRLKAMEKKTIELKKGESKGALKTELSTIKPTVKTVEVR